MVVHGKKAAYGKLNQMDRLSDLPDSILHNIISYLGTEEACRTTILSKRWAHVWSTGLILEFKPQYFVPKIDGDFVGNINDPYSDETVKRFMNFIECTMRRYSEKNLSIRKFKLKYPSIDPEMTGRIDRWVGIALRNQVEELSLSVIPDPDKWEDPPLYTLPAILFSAKSLMSMKLFGVRLPYIEDVKLVSLQSLNLSRVDVDQQMLRDIIMSCPLKILKLERCSGLPNISIPCCSRLESLHVAETVPIGGTISVDTSSLQCCTYIGCHFPWPVILTPSSKKNLRELRIYSTFIKNDIFDKLVSELPSTVTIAFFSCTMQKCIRIASQTLKDLSIHDCDNLSRVTMEAPKLDTFCYNGGWRLSSVINSHNSYNAYFYLTVTDLDTRAFYSIKQLLGKSKCCKVLSISVSDEIGMPEIELDKDQLRYFSGRPPSDAIDVQELKLCVSCDNSIPSESSCRALIDGLLWCCRPDILSLSVTFSFENSVIKTFLEVLQKKVKYWKHPLKRMEIEGTDCSSLLLSWDLEVRFRLYW